MENKIFSVKNRSASRCGYLIAESGVRREFAPGEVKRITFEELEKLSFQAGGRELMANFLQIEEVAVKSLGIRTEPEYWMSEQKIAELLLIGSLDAFLDCLDFAPIGVMDIVKKLAVSLPLSDYEKRKALKAKTGFDVDKALANLAAEKAEENSESDAPTRRVKTEEPSTPGRRTSGSEYKVVKMGE